MTPFEPYAFAMVQPFSSLVTSQAWRHDVEAWVHDRVEESGRRLSGPLDQVRVRPWSTQLTVPTDHGRLWFKANTPSMGFEPALHQLLATLSPDDVAAPVAIDPVRGWMLTADRGPTLGEVRNPTTDDWVRLIQHAAALQRRVADRRDELVGLGVHDCSPPRVPERFDSLVEQLSNLPAGHPSRLRPDDLAALEDRRADLVEAAVVLERSPVPSSLQHGDVHPDNAFADLKVFDFGDVQWAHAVEVLRVPFGIISQDDTVEWGPVRDAYFEVWGDVADRRTMAALFEATAFTQAVNRCLVWVDTLQLADADEIAEWGVAPRHQLMRVVDA